MEHDGELKNMQRIISFDDCEGLASLLNATYPIRIAGIRKHRDWIGYVYHVDCSDGAYVLKIYRPFHAQFALNSIDVLRYLARQNYPAARIVDTAAGAPYTTISTPGGKSIAILFARIEGDEPDPDADLPQIARQTGILHNLMDRYEGELARCAKEHYIDRYLAILENIGFPENKLRDLKNYGDELWDRFDFSSKGFCHGDLHCGNMLKTRDGQYWLFDFDAACYSHPSADIAVMSDDTDYFRFRQEDFDKTARRLERFLSGYERARGVATSERDIQAVYDFIAIRHYDIQATITDCQGFSMKNLENQHGWLMSWRDLCARRIKY